MQMRIFSENLGKVQEKVRFIYEFVLFPTTYRYLYDNFLMWVSRRKKHHFTKIKARRFFSNFDSIQNTLYGVSVTTNKGKW